MFTSHLAYMVTPGGHILSEILTTGVCRKRAGVCALQGGHASRAHFPVLLPGVRPAGRAGGSRRAHVSDRLRDVVVQRAAAGRRSGHHRDLGRHAQRARRREDRREQAGAGEHLMTCAADAMNR